MGETLKLLVSEYIPNREVLHAQWLKTMLNLVGIHVCQTKRLLLKIFSMNTWSITLLIQSWPKISAPRVNMNKEGCENESALLILLIFYLKHSQQSNL